MNMHFLTICLKRCENAFCHNTHEHMLSWSLKTRLLTFCHNTCEHVWTRVLSPHTRKLVKSSFVAKCVNMHEHLCCCHMTENTLKSIMKCSHVFLLIFNLWAAAQSHHERFYKYNQMCRKPYALLQREMLQICALINNRILMKKRCLKDSPWKTP